jgi:hypothetical protein
VDLRDSRKCPDILSIGLDIGTDRIQPLSDNFKFLLMELRCHHEALHSVGEPFDAFIDRQVLRITALRSKLRFGDIRAEAVGGENAILYADDTTPGMHLAG